MEVRYRRELNQAYMILPKMGECEEYGLRILQENTIPGVMPLSVRQMDGQEEYYFDITDSRSLSRVLERRTVSLEEICQVLEALGEVTGKLEEYLMNPNHLILDPDLIYLRTMARDPEARIRSGEADFSRAVFCCHPASESDVLEQIRELMQYFLNKMDHMDGGSVEIAYELFHVTQKEYFRMDELLEICRQVPEKQLRTEKAVSPAEDRNGDGREADPDTEETETGEERSGPGSRFWWIATLLPMAAAGLVTAYLLAL